MDLGTILNGLTSGALYAIVALGLSLVFGVMRLVNLAHGDIMVAGAYLSTLAIGLTGLDPMLTSVLVGPVVFVVAYLLQRFVFTGLLRRGEEPPLVAAFGLSLVISSLLVMVFGGDSRSLPAPYADAGVTVLGVPMRVTSLLTLGIAVVVIVGTHLVVKTTPWGTALRAASTDADTASTMGIDVKNVYALTFATGAVFAMLAGLLIGVGYSFTPGTGSSYLLIGFTVVVLGGTGSVLGSLWAGLAIGLVQALGGQLLGGEYRDLIVYVVFLLIILVRPVLASTIARRPRRMPTLAEAVQ